MPRIGCFMRSFFPFTATVEVVEPPPKPPPEAEDAAAAAPWLLPWKPLRPASLRPTATVEVVEPPPKPPPEAEDAAAAAPWLLRNCCFMRSFLPFTATVEVVEPPPRPPPADEAAAAAAPPSCCQAALWAEARGTRARTRSERTRMVVVVVFWSGKRERGKAEGKEEKVMKVFFFEAPF